MKVHVGGTVDKDGNKPTPTTAERTAFRDRLEREIGEAASGIVTHLDRSAAPGPLRSLVRVVIPAASRAAGALLEATHADSPGGRKLTRDELEEIASATSRHVYDDVLAELLDQVGLE